MQGRSTERVIYQLINEISASLNIGQRSAAMNLDLSSALDSVDINVLITKLHRNDVRGIPLKLANII